MTTVTLSSPDWEETFFRDVYNYASRSKDPRTKIGAVLVDWDSKTPVSHGYNGFPRNVLDTQERWERPQKYELVIHGEMNSILNCARFGQSTLGTVLLSQGFPCNLCSLGIANAGIKEVIFHQQWISHEIRLNHKKWLDSAEISKQVFSEAGVQVRVYDKFLGIKGFLDGQVIDV
jgi:dCMP deaminase